MDRASPLRTTHLRDPYGPPILFGSESFMDEVAAATNTDPVDFRLQYLKNPRDRDAVRIAAEHYGWEKRPSPRNDQKDADVAVGRGIAFRRHFDTFIALIAEVRVHRKTGKLDLLRYVCAHDVGMIVNPETLRHVIDRQLVYGTSRAMFEEVRFDQNMVTSVDWLTYPVLHIDDSRKIEIVLIKRPEAAPSGAAEMALGLVPAAIGNAVFDATGVRLRRVPFTPERVKAALEKACFPPAKREGDRAQRGEGAQRRLAPCCTPPTMLAWSPPLRFLPAGEDKQPDLHTSGRLYSRFGPPFCDLR